MGCKLATCISTLGSSTLTMLNPVLLGWDLEISAVFRLVLYPLLLMNLLSCSSSSL